MLRIHLCGRVVVETEHGLLPESLFPGRQGRIVFAYLVLERRRTVTRDELADAVWAGDAMPASWAASLNAIISKLRRMLTRAGLDGPSSLVGAFGTYQLRLPQDAWIDAEAGVAETERALAAGDAAVSANAAAEARRLLGSELLPGEDGAWIAHHRDALRHALLTALDVEAEASLRSGDPARAVAAALEAVSREPFRESGYRTLMRAHAAAGNRAEALRVWERCRKLLGEELGTDPAPETEAVYLQLLRNHAPAAAPSGVLTFMLTDIEGSTELWEHNQSAMARALERHDALVAAAVSMCGGRLIKSKGEGDSTLSVFTRAGDACAAAIALQESIAAEPWPADTTPLVRVAVHTGEAIERDGDYYGPPLNRAAGLRDLARGGQIVLSQSAAELARDHLPSDVRLEDLGTRVLRGFERSERVFAMPGVREPAARAAGTARIPQLPAPIVHTTPLVGRRSELETLRDAWGRAGAGEPIVTFVAGEPGIGKTRLVSEVAAQVHADGALVLYGRCDEDLRAPFQPFAEALSRHVRHDGARGWRPSDVAELARLVPDLADGPAGPSRPLTEDPAAERYRLFEAVASVLATESEQAAVLMVLDDVHWATAPTLQLLRHLARDNRNSRVLVVATYRDTEDDLPGELREMVTDALRLGPLSDVDVASLVPAQLASMASVVHAETRGNPFFVTTMVRHLLETAGQGVPDDALDVITRRVMRLGEDVHTTLRAASVAGIEFDVDVAASASDVPEHRVVDALELALRARLLDEVAVDRYAFVHGLVRRCLYDSLSATRRARLHGRVASALEQRAEQAGVTFAELAHHFAMAGPAGDRAKTCRYLELAGDEALDHFAFEDAAGHYQKALEWLDDDASPARGRLLIGVARAAARRGDATTVFRTLREVLPTATADGLAEELAGVLVEATSFLASNWDQEGWDLGRAALNELGDPDTPLKSILLSRLALATQSADTPHAMTVHTVPLSVQAHEMATRTGDPRALAAAIQARLLCDPDPQLFAHRPGMLGSLVSLSVHTGDDALLMNAHLWLAMESLARGHAEEAREAIDEFERLGARTGHPWTAWRLSVVRATLARMRGEFDTADELATRGLQEGSAAGVPQVMVYYAGHLGQLRRDQGRLLEIADAVAAMGGAIEVLVYAEVGRSDDARRLFEKLAANNFAAVAPRFPNYWGELAFLSDGCVALGDAPRARILGSLLAPYAGRHFVASGFGVYWGPAELTLGRLAATAGDRDDAERHLVRAIQMCEAVDTPPWKARAHLALAELLRESDPAQSRSLAADAGEIAERIGMAELASKARDLARR